MHCEKNHIIKSARIIAVLCVALIFSGCLADSVANSGSAAVSTSEAAQVQSEISNSEIAAPNLDELEAFLTDSGVIYWLEARPLDSIIAGAPALTPELRMMVSQCLRAAANENRTDMNTNDEGVPFFAIEDFVHAAKELTGLEYNFEDIAKINSDKAPDGMLCVTWGYDTPLNNVIIDEKSLTKTELGYTVELENQYSSPGEGFLPGEKLLLTFSQNTDYIACPFRLIAVTSIEK